MRRKRLQHVADNLCQMFCGWRQTSSKPQGSRLGTGHLTIDVLSGACAFNGQAVEPLPIAAELRVWLEQDLEQHRVPKDALKEATVHADLSLETVPWDPVVRTQFFKDGEPVNSGPMQRCVVKCTSLVRTHEAEYRGEYNDVERWPIGWPAA
jgi:hypothetical protein